MAGIMSFVGSIDTIVQCLRRAYEFLQEIPAHLKNDLDQELVALDRRDIRLRLGVDVEKLLGWQSLWLADSEHSADTLGGLWGERGPQKVATLLQALLQDSRDVLCAASQLTRSKSKCAATKIRDWKRATSLKHLPKLHRSSTNHGITTSQNKEIRLSVDRLSDHIDELWLLSESLFRNLHPVLRASSMDFTGSAIPSPNVGTKARGQALVAAI